jgi:thiol-disulfide isomerase/thioredoxin
MKTFISFFPVSLLALLLAVLLSGCSNPKAPNITISDMRQASQTLNLAQPNKPVLLVFWATSCPSCIDEIPALIKLQQQFGDQLAVVGVAMDYDDPNQLAHLVQQRNLPYLVVHDHDQKIAVGFGKIFVTPTNILLSAHGEQVWKNVGTPDMISLAKRIQDLLSSS